MLYQSIYRDCHWTSLQKHVSQSMGKKGRIVKQNIDHVLYQSNYRDCNMDLVQKHIRESMEK